MVKVKFVKVKVKDNANTYAKVKFSKVKIVEVKVMINYNIY